MDFFPLMPTACYRYFFHESTFNHTLQINKRVWCLNWIHFISRIALVTYIIHIYIQTSDIDYYTFFIYKLPLQMLNFIKEENLFWSISPTNVKFLTINNMFINVDL